VYQT
jgi:hypothetical protein